MGPMPRVSKKFFFSLVLALLAFLSPAQAADAKCDQKNDPLCRGYHRQVIGPGKAVDCMIALNIKQEVLAPASTRKVTIMFFKNGKPLDLNDPLHTQMKKADDVFKTGCHWWKKADKVIVCNDDAGRDLGPETIALYIKQGGSAPGRYVHIRRSNAGQ